MDSSWFGSTLTHSIHHIPWWVDEKNLLTKPWRQFYIHLSPPSLPKKTGEFSDWRKILSVGILGYVYGYVWWCLGVHVMWVFPKIMVPQIIHFGVPLFLETSMSFWDKKLHWPPVIGFLLPPGWGESHSAFVSGVGWCSPASLRRSSEWGVEEFDRGLFGGCNFFWGHGKSGWKRHTSQECWAPKKFCSPEKGDMPQIIRGRLLSTKYQLCKAVVSRIWIMSFWNYKRQMFGSPKGFSRKTLDPKINGSLIWWGLVQCLDLPAIYLQDWHPWWLLLVLKKKQLSCCAVLGRFEGSSPHFCCTDLVCVFFLALQHFKDRLYCDTIY